MKSPAKTTPPRVKTGRSTWRELSPEGRVLFGLSAAITQGK